MKMKSYLFSTASAFFLTAAGVKHRIGCLAINFSKVMNRVGISLLILSLVAKTKQLSELIRRLLPI